MSEIETGKLLINWVQCEEEGLKPQQIFYEKGYNNRLYICSVLRLMVAWRACDSGMQE
jgi:hypothetical protein